MRHSKQVYVVMKGGVIHTDAFTSLLDVAGLLNNKPSYKTLQRHFSTSGIYKKNDVQVVRVGIVKIERAGNLSNLRALNTTNA